MDRGILAKSSKGGIHRIHLQKAKETNNPLERTFYYPVRVFVSVYKHLLSNQYSMSMFAEWRILSAQEGCCNLPPEQTSDIHHHPKTPATRVLTTFLGAQAIYRPIFFSWLLDLHKSFSAVKQNLLFRDSHPESSLVISGKNEKI